MRKLSFLLFTLLVVVTLSACGPKKTTTNTTGNQVKSEDYYGLYVSNITDLNYMRTNKQENNMHFANFVDGLVENDEYGRVVPSLAESWTSEILADGKTQVWTFNLRHGVKWVDSDGNEYAELKAQDFVTPAKWLLNPVNNSETTPLWFMFVKNAQEYYCGLEVKGDPTSDCGEGLTLTTNFNDVGVKAVNDYTLQYTLVKPAPYFLTVLTYSPFFPVNASYLEEQGENFGFDKDAILYNGAYILTQDVPFNSINYAKNVNYWDKENVHINKVFLKYQPDKATPDLARKMFENGEISGFRLTEDDTEGWEKYVTANNGTPENPYNGNVYMRDEGNSTTYYITWNFNRTVTTGSLLSQGELADLSKAILNKDFRLAFTYGLDRTSYLSLYTPSNPAQWVRNTFTPRELALDENGNDYVDTYYKVYAENKGITVDAAKELLRDGHDGLYNHVLAQQHMAAAKTALEAQGVKFPVKLDYFYYASVNNNRRAVLLEQAVEKEFPGLIDVVLDGDVDPAFTDKVDTLNFSIYSPGWGPDYADPATFLNTLTSTGDMIDYSGLRDNTAVLGEVDKLVADAEKFWKPNELSQRYEKFAQAEYRLIYEDAVIIPFFSPYLGKEYRVSKIKPFSNMTAPYGLSTDKFKRMIVLTNPITREERNQMQADYEAAKANLNK